MRDLINLDDYVATIGGGLGRMSIVTGAVFGLTMGLFGLLALWPTAGPERALALAVLGGASSGLIFGFFFPRSLQKKMQRIARSVFTAEGRYAAPPPAGTWTARVPCNYLLGSIGVGGLLYLQPGGFAFVPHSGNLPRHRQIVTATGEPLTVKLIALPPSWWHSLVIAERPPLLELASASKAWRFVVPEPEKVLAGIETELAIPVDQRK